MGVRRYIRILLAKLIKFNVNILLTFSQIFFFQFQILASWYEGAQYNRGFCKYNYNKVINHIFMTQNERNRKDTIISITLIQYNFTYMLPPSALKFLFKPLTDVSFNIQLFIIEK